MGVITIDLPSLKEISFGSMTSKSSCFYHGSLVLKGIININ